MSRIDALVRLYRLALAPPTEERNERIADWLAERQAIVSHLEATPPRPLERAVERALLALILSADRSTHDTLMRKRRELAALMRRPRGYA